jgi:hypothetical protein
MPDFYEHAEGPWRGPGLTEDRQMGECIRFTNPIIRWMPGITIPDLGNTKPQ